MLAMERQHPWLMPSWAKHKQLITALTVVALGCALVHINSQALFLGNPSASAPHRRNGRRRQRDQAAAGQVAADLDETSSDNSDDSEQERRKENVVGDDGQNLRELLYRIAEDRTRKESYVHRGVTCDACHAMPIRGIRYHCTNCVDYDLCEQCEAMQIHPKTHVFYKLRIPAPFLRVAEEPEPTLYPGKTRFISYSLDKKILPSLVRDTGYQAAEIEALWEQFQCLAAKEDPDFHHPGIDQKTFEKCLAPQSSRTQAPPNLIYDRLFSFYDQNDDGLITFDEFVLALATLTRKKPEEKWKRLFDAYDTNNDGFVERRDFLRIFQAYYAITKQLSRNALTQMEEEVTEESSREIIEGIRPISAAFNVDIEAGRHSRAAAGKSVDQFGDAQIHDGIGVFDERSHNLQDPNETIADVAEINQYGALMSRTLTERSDLLLSDTWPPEDIELSDIEEILGEGVNLLEVLPKDQESIRQVAHERLLRAQQELISFRMEAIQDRKARKTFYLDVHQRDYHTEAPANKFSMPRSPAKMGADNANERFTRAQVPSFEPEMGLGQEILYQVVQEGVNELLDPIFKLKEDLSMSAMQTEEERMCVQEHTASAVQEAMEIKMLLEIYQRRWRSENATSSGEPLAPWFEKNQSRLFFTFFQQREAGAMNPLTTEYCLRCAREGQLSQMGMGYPCQICEQLGVHFLSFQERLSGKILEICGGCAEQGRDMKIPRGFRCSVCGHCSSQYLAQEASLRNKILDRRSYPLPPLEYPRPDPTLPQNRPDTDMPQCKIPNVATLKYFASLALIEAEADERGGPGRLNFDEFMDVMKGEKGQSLGFIDSWLDFACF